MVIIMQAAPLFQLREWLCSPQFNHSFRFVPFQIFRLQLVCKSSILTAPSSLTSDNSLKISRSVFKN